MAWRKLADQKRKLGESIEMLRNARGRVRTFEENKLILVTAYQFQRDLLERGETITRTALAHHVGRQLHVTASGGNCSVAVLLKAWEDKHEILYTERSGAAPRVKARQLTPEHVAEIESSSSGIMWIGVSPLPLLHS